MPSKYQEFLAKARERFQERQKKKSLSTGGFAFTRHAEYKMRQYGLSMQKIKSVIRSPKRREEGIVPRTVAVMQPVSVKKVETGKPARPGDPGRSGGETWKQEIWVMYQLRKSETISIRQLADQIPISKKIRNPKSEIHNSSNQRIRIISAWRYPGISPKRNPIPEDILRELESGEVFEDMS